MKNNKKKVIFTIGCPASGKTTWVKNYILNEYNGVNGSCVNIDTDDIRMMLYQKAYEPKGEALAWDVFNRILEESLLSDNVDEIIISNTNLNFDKLKVLTNKIEFHHDVEFEFKFFDVELDELLRRDALREKSVGENVIKSFHNKYEDTVLKIKQFFKLKK